MSGFFAAIDQTSEKNDSLLCVGLDTDVGRLPRVLANDPDPIFSFNREIIDATCDLVSCYKLQIAYYAAVAAEESLQKSIRYAKDRGIPVILDYKRGDIDSSAEKYALEAFERYDADAITINPYMGADAMQPFFDYSDKGIFVLCRTSNPGGAAIQNLMLANGDRVYQHIARLAVTEWNQSANVGLVVGATRPEEIKAIRDIAGAMHFLMPGVGAQGADIKTLVDKGQGGGMVINASRAILYASKRSDFARAARCEAIKTRDAINVCR